MSIVILVGGSNEQGNAEHRYLVGQFLDSFGDKVDRIITAKPQVRAPGTRLKRMIKRGNYSERMRRAFYRGGYGPADSEVQRLLLPLENEPVMPGTDKVSVVTSHNSEACRALINAAKPQVLVVYGTAIIRASTFSLSTDITLNMHTGLSPYYRGDSTLFWPVYYNDRDQLGVTVHQLVESVDGGDIAATALIEYETGDTEAHLFAKAVKAGTRLYVDAVKNALNGTLVCTPQDLSIGREFSWKDRTVDAEHKVLAQLRQWESTSGNNAH